MDRYTKSFIVASLLYFALASVLGMWMGLTAVPSWARFAHVHLNLLGFMAMMIYGVGYFVLPRFNARELRWPAWVPIHFWGANLGLVGMVVTYPEIPSAGFVLFAGLSVASVFLFAVNLGATLLLPEKKEGAEGSGSPRAAPPPRPAPRGPSPGGSSPAGPSIEAGTRVGEILTRWPHTAELFVQSGFEALGDPAHREQVKQLPVTLEMACARHGVDLREVIERLRDAVAAGEASQGGAIRAEQVLGDILAAHPETEPVFLKYYGSGCFSCPGQATETVKQSAMIHNVDVERLLDELNRAAGTSRGSHLER
jgi:hybrid cluster-associated redox disulfide protein